MPLPTVLVATAGDEAPADDHTVHEQPPTLILTGANGDTIRLDDHGTGYWAGANSGGVFGRPPVELRLTDTAGDGASYSGARRATRPIDLIVSVASATGAEQRARLDRLAEVLDTEQYGPATLSVVCPDCGPDKARTIPVLYSSGWDGATTVDTDLRFERIPLTLVAPDPYYTLASALTYPISIAAALPLLSDTLPLLPLRVASSQVLGAIQVANPGDVASPALWTFTGPGGPITVYPGTTDPTLGFRITGNLTAGHTLTLDTDAQTLVDETGADAYSRLDTAPAFFTIPPGTSTITVTMANATLASAVQLAFHPRFKRGM